MLQWFAEKGSGRLCRSRAEYVSGVRARSPHPASATLRPGFRDGDVQGSLANSDGNFVPTRQSMSPANRDHVVIFGRRLERDVFIRRRRRFFKRSAGRAFDLRDCAAPDSRRRPRTDPFGLLLGCAFDREDAQFRVLVSDLASLKIGGRGVRLLSGFKTFEHGDNDPRRGRGACKRNRFAA